MREVTAEDEDVVQPLTDIPQAQGSHDTVTRYAFIELALFCHPFVGNFLNRLFFILL